MNYLTCVINIRFVNLKQCKFNKNLQPKIVNPKS